MDKTVDQRQRRFRAKIIRGEKKRVQVVIDRDQAKKLDDICAKEGISKTDFVRRAIESWPI